MTSAQRETTPGWWATTEELVAALQPGTAVDVHWRGRPAELFLVTATFGADGSIQRPRLPTTGSDAQSAALIAQQAVQIAGAREQLRRAESVIRAGVAACDEVLGNRLAAPAVARAAAHIRGVLAPKPSAAQERMSP